jgi:hypothetical protein
MLQAHSFLWHYLWVAPNALSLILAGYIWRRGIQRRYPFFLCYLLFVALEQFSLYVLDLSPKVSPITWWRAFWFGTIIEGLLKFAVLAELLHHLLHCWPSVAKLGRNLVSGAGVLLVLLAAGIAPFAAPDNTPKLVGGAHILSQTLYMTEAGLIVSIFLLAGFFKIPWDRMTFGIAVGFGFVWCEHLAVWALVTGGLVRNRGWEDFANMATYHLCVLAWFYYLLVSPKVSRKNTIPPKGPSAGPPIGPTPEEDLEVWNRELERLVHP